ncbi:MAG: type II toxin-antitoxin system PemK/MazF family toxin [Chloroflexota bacterium]|nr:type II toxin-antitoxin system PemK/MazF family toxin [Chloroflexota bacterium]
MVVERGEIWWADLGDPVGAQPGFRRPVVIVQADGFNRSRIETTIALSVTSNLQLVDAPGNVLLPSAVTGLPKDSVANVSQIMTLDLEQLVEPAGRVGGSELTRISRGLRLVLGI